MFVFDESFKTLPGNGSAIDLAPWYGQGEVSILGMGFVCGTEEVALVDSNAQVRIFSLVTLQFRFVFSPLYKFRSPCRVQRPPVDRRPCSSRLPQRYTLSAGWILPPRTSHPRFGTITHCIPYGKLRLD